MATQTDFVKSLKHGVDTLQARARDLSERMEVAKNVSSVQQRVISGTADALRWQADGLVKLAGSLEGWAVRLDGKRSGEEAGKDEAHPVAAKHHT